MSDDKPGAGPPPAAAWQKWAALGVLAAVVACVIAFHDRLSADFVPFDASRIGPNIIASALTWAFLFTAAVLLWPPWRRRLHRFIDRKVAPLHAKVDRLEAHHKALAVRHDEHAQSLASLHEKLDALQATRPVVRVRASRAKPASKPKEPRK